MLNNLEFSETVKNTRNRTSRMDREGDYWTEYEKEKLVQLFYEGVGITEIAIQLQRTEPAVIQQIEKMDLYRRKENPSRRRKSGPNPFECLCKHCKRPRELCRLCEKRTQYQEDN